MAEVFYEPETQEIEPETRPAPPLPRLRDWMELRIGWQGFVYKNLNEPMPAGVGWWQTLGNLMMTLLGFQFITGIALAMYYAPSPDHAYQSLQYLRSNVWLGSFIHGLHHWGASAIVIVMGLHIFRVFLWGSYKKPRELTWVIGVLIMMIVLAFSFTGYLLPWDQKAYWATVVGTQIAETIPGAGEAVMRLIRGGDEIGALTLTRFYALHVLVLPAILVGLTAFHLYLVRRHHIAGPTIPQRGKPVPFWPNQLFKDAIVVLIGVGTVALYAAFVQVPLETLADPSDTSYVPKPEWYFFALYELLKIIPSEYEVVGTLLIPGAGILAMLLLPWLDRGKTRHPFNRQLVVDVGLAVIIIVGILTFKGMIEQAPHTEKKPVAAKVEAQQPPAVSPASAAVIPKEGSNAGH